MTDPPTDRPPGSGEPQLTDADMRVLDFLAEHGFDASRVHLLPEADRPRAMALVRQMQVLDHYPADTADDTLVDATLARIDRWEAASAEARRLEPRRIGAFRLADLIGIAAVLMVGTAVLVPVARSVRANGLANACRANMRTVGTALASYAAGHDGLLPATASIADIGSLFGRRRTPRPGAPTAPRADSRRSAHRCRSTCARRTRGCASASNAWSGTRSTTRRTSVRSWPASTAARETSLALRAPPDGRASPTGCPCGASDSCSTAASVRW
jgi:hypothetical protein